MATQNTLSSKDKCIPAHEGVETQSSNTEAPDSTEQCIPRSLAIRTLKMIFASLYHVPIIISREPDEDLFALMETMAIMMEAHDLTEALSADVTGLIKAKQNWSRFKFETDHARFLNLAYKLRSASLLRIAYIRLVNDCIGTESDALAGLDEPLKRIIYSGIRELGEKINRMFFELISFRDHQSYSYENHDIPAHVGNAWRWALASKFACLGRSPLPIRKIAEHYADIYTGKLEGFDTGTNGYPECSCSSSFANVAAFKVKNCQQRHLDFAKKVIRNSSAQLTILDNPDEAVPCWHKDVTLFVGLGEPEYPWKNQRARPPLTV